jgi:hypothetical protein
MYALGSLRKELNRMPINYRADLNSRIGFVGNEARMA